jgi:hypothetical protein
MRIAQQPPEVRRMRDARRDRLAPDTPVLAATLTQVRKRCGQPACRCDRGAPHRAWPLTSKVKGRTRTVCVPHDLLHDGRAAIAAHQRIKTLRDEIHPLTVALIRGPLRHQKRPAGRRSTSARLSPVPSGTSAPMATPGSTGSPSHAARSASSSPAAASAGTAC